MKRIMLIALLLLPMLASANPITAARDKAINKALGNCGNDWIPGNCVLRVWGAYKAGSKAIKVASDLAQARELAKIKARKKAIVRKGNIKKIRKFARRAFKYSPPGRAAKAAKLLKRAR